MVMSKAPSIADVQQFIKRQEERKELDAYIDFRARQFATSVVPYIREYDDKNLLARDFIVALIRYHLSHCSPCVQYVDMWFNGGKRLLISHLWGVLRRTTDCDFQLIWLVQTDPSYRYTVGEMVNYPDLMMSVRDEVISALYDYAPGEFDGDWRDYGDE